MRRLGRRSSGVSRTIETHRRSATNSVKNSKLQVKATAREKPASLHCGHRSCAGEMRLNIFRISKWMSGAIIVILALCAYPFIMAGISFEARRSKIADLIETVDSADRTLPQPARDLLLLSLANDTVSYSARLLIREFDAWPPNRNAASWAVFYATWCGLVALHFSEQDRLALIARFAPIGNDRSGLNHTAEAIYDRPLSALSLTETGTLMALIREPSLHKNLERLSTARDRLLSRYENKQ